jgi:hypothetical protein
MTAGIYNFSVDQGSVFTLNMVYEDPDGNPINLSGQTARMQFRRKYNSADPADLTLTTSNGGIAITGATGNILVTITDEQTSTLDEGFYVYDLELDNAGVISRLVQGQVTVNAQVTQNA